MLLVFNFIIKHSTYMWACCWHLLIFTARTRWNYICQLSTEDTVGKESRFFPVGVIQHLTFLSFFLFLVFLQQLRA